MHKSIKEEGKKSKEKNIVSQMRYSIFRTVGMIKYSIDRLDREKGEIISLARDAKKRQDESAYQSLKKRLSLCLVNMRLLSEMLSQLEISIELDNMDRMVESYNSCMDSFRKQHSIAQNPRGLLKNCKEAKSDFDQAIGFYNELYENLSSDRGGFGHQRSRDVTYGELEHIIDGEINREEVEDEALDAKIQLIRSKIKEV